MTKEWLIRTKNNHILGPVSKEKIKQLVSSGSIKGDDEVCSGNGFWLYIREQELISKYVFGDTQQGFNPVQEALPILSSNAISSERRELEDGENSMGVLPCESDLMYPDAENFVESQTEDTSIDIGNSDPRTPPIPKAKVSAPVAKLRVKNEKPAIDKEPPPLKEIQNKKQASPSEAPVTKTQKSLSSRKLVLFTFFFVIICAVLLYYSNTLVKKIIETTSSHLIPTAVAQTLPLVKKKNGSTLLK